MTREMETALRECFASDAEAVAAPPDPWARFTRRAASRRRTRRLRVAVLAAAVGTLVGVQTNLVPLPGWAPGIAVAGGTPAFTDVPPRGGLASDEAWLSGLRRRVADVSDPDGLWKVTDRDQIRIVYAGEVPGWRVAVLHRKLRLGLVTVWDRAYYLGPPGAAPEQMEEAGNTDAGLPVATLAYGGYDEGGVALVVGPPEATVSISIGFAYSPAGVLERRPLGLASRDGVLAVALPAGPRDPDPYARVTLGDKVIFEAGISNGWRGAAGEERVPEAALAGARAAARGTPIDTAALAFFVDSGFRDAQLPVRDTALRLLWCGEVEGEAAALFTLQPPGGGVIAYAMHGTATSGRYDLRLLLPAEGAHTRPLGWRMRASGRDDPTDRVYVVAPPGTARVTLTAGTGQPVPVPVDADGFGAGAVPPEQPAHVTAYAADGREIASTPVPPFERSMGDLPGATRGTRIVD